MSSPIPYADLPPEQQQKMLVAYLRNVLEYMIDHRLKSLGDDLSALTDLDQRKLLGSVTPADLLEGRVGFTVDDFVNAHFPDDIGTTMYYDSLKVLEIMADRGLLTRSTSIKDRLTTIYAVVPSGFMQTHRSSHPQF